MKAAWAIAVLSLSLIGSSAWAAHDPQTGRWKLDLKRSKYETAALPKSSLTTLVPYGRDGITLSVDVITAAGLPQHIEYSAQYDGKRYPRTETGAGATPGQTVSLRRVGPRTVERTVYLGDKSGGTEQWTISKDGQTRTVHQFGVDLHGKPIHNLQIYVRR